MRPIKKLFVAIKEINLDLNGRNSFFTNNLVGNVPAPKAQCGVFDVWNGVASFSILYNIML